MLSTLWTSVRFFAVFGSILIRALFRQWRDKRYYLAIYAAYMESHVRASCARKKLPEGYALLPHLRELLGSIRIADRWTDNFYRALTKEWREKAGSPYTFVAFCAAGLLSAEAAAQYYDYVREYHEHHEQQLKGAGG